MGLENRLALAIRKPVATAILQICRSCDHEFRVLSSLVGKKLACPHCRRPMAIGPESAVKEDKLVGKELGGCKLVRRLGAGAIGVVYEAQQLSIGRSVAIKMMSSKAATNPKVVQRFQRESKLCAQMQHPNVVSVYDCGFERGVHYLIMEYVEGQTLSSMLDELERLPWATATRLVLQVARGLEHAHALDIIHRDIKPANILIENGTTAKLADLGLAKQVDSDPTAGGGLTMQGIAMGSPAYMPPEQIRNARDATAVADIYALGATFYQAVTGVIPFDGKNGTEVMTKVLREEPKPVTSINPEVPAGVAALIHSMLAKDPGGRPQSTGELIREIEAVQADPDRRPKVSARASSSGVGSSGNWVLIAAVVLVAVIVVLVIWKQHT
jgi:serine/threonine protein kinase